MVSLFAAAFALASCASPTGTNTSANTNTNTNAAPKAAAPAADTLMAMDSKAFDAWKNKDGQYFEGYIADNFVGFDDGKRSTKAELLKMMESEKCDVKSVTPSDPHVTPVGADAAVLTYKVAQDATCNGEKLPANVTAASVFVRSGDTWKGVYHNEVAVVEPKAGAEGDKKASTANAIEEKKGIDTSPGASADTKPSADKKVAPAATTTTASSNGNAASNSNSAAGGATSADASLTAGLAAMEKKGWEAWKSKDAKVFEEILSKDFAFIDSMGKATFGKAEGIKMWTTDNPCTVSSVDVSDANGSMITKDAAILTYKGTATGTCGDMKLTPLWGTTVAVKEGEVWKAVYIFEAPIT